MGLKNLLLDTKQNLIKMDLGLKNFIQLYFFYYGTKPNSTPGHLIQKIGVNPFYSNRLNFTYKNQFHWQFFLLKTVSKCEFKLFLK